MSTPAETNPPPPAEQAPTETTAPPPPTTTTSSAPPYDSSTTTTAGGTPQPFHSASLYVGDLAPDVNESLLFEIFNAVGPVASIRVCRDAITRRSLGYAYVNFHVLADAERALETMNYTMIKHRPCRIMWSQRDPSLRRSGVGNIFVKNLHESIDNKQLYDTFGLFGKILSCKVVTDRETGRSKGYGYVHYETAEAANDAIARLDGMLIDDQEIQVGHFMRRNERPGTNEWTNCFIKNIPYEWDDAQLKAAFEPYGEILSATVSTGVRKKFPKKTTPPPKKEEEEDKSSKEDAATTETKQEDEDDAKKPEEEEEAKKQDETKKEEEDPKKPEEEEAKTTTEEDVPKKEEKEEAPPQEEEVEPQIQSLGFGFVNFANHDDAVKAVEEMNGKSVTTIDPEGNEVTQELFVGRAQKKQDRERELRAKFEAEKMERISKFQGVNLYVKNLDDSVTDDLLRDEFAAMGTITSARIMRDVKSGQSRGFGFVCFSTPEEATRAVNEMNGKLIANKPIFVALAQRREVRRAQLEAQHARQSGAASMSQGGMMRGNPQMMGYPPSASMGAPMYMQRAGNHPMQPAYPMMPAQMMSGRGSAGQAQRMYPIMGGGGGAGGGRGGYHPMSAAYGGGGGMQQGGGRGGSGRGGVSGRGGRGRGGGPMQQQQHQQGRGTIKFNSQVRNANMAQQQAPNQPQPQAMSSADSALTASALASASPAMQKNMIGERLYPLIHQSQPELAGKITGMLLEMDNSELLHLLESPEALNAKIQEALQVLEAHNAAATEQQG